MTGYVLVLLVGTDHCTRNSIRQPIFKHEMRPNGKYSVSVIVDREKFSLPTPFDSIPGGREEVAKQVLNRVKGGTKRERKSDT
jgi:hypothetical protein